MMTVDNLGRIDLPAFWAGLRPDHPADRRSPLGVPSVGDLRSEPWDGQETAPQPVDDPGRIDFYQRLYFLALHARRHLAQLQSVETESAVSSSR